MPIDIKYYPEDVSQKEYGFLGIKLPMNSRGYGSNSGVFNTSLTTEDQAVSNYINLLLTRQGERYMQPEFGVGVQYYIFEQNTEELRVDLDSEIRRQAAFWLPYIVNHSIDVKVAADIPALGGDPEHGIQIVIVFSVFESGANRTITIFQREGVTNIEVF